MDHLTDIDMLLMVEKCITGRICHPFYRYAKANKWKIAISSITGCKLFNMVV